MQLTFRYIEKKSLNVSGTVLPRSNESSRAYEQKPCLLSCDEFWMIPLPVTMMLLTSSTFPASFAFMSMRCRDPHRWSLYTVVLYLTRKQAQSPAVDCGSGESPDNEQLNKMFLKNYIHAFGSYSSFHVYNLKSS